MAPIVEPDRQDLARGAHAGAEPQVALLAQRRAAGRPRCCFERGPDASEARLALGEQAPWLHWVAAIGAVERQHAIGCDDAQAQSVSSLERDQLHGRLLRPPVWSAAAGRW